MTRARLPLASLIPTTLGSRDARPASRRDVGDRAAGHIVEDDRHVEVGDGREMRGDPVLVGAVVIRQHDQRGVGARVLARPWSCAIAWPRVVRLPQPAMTGTRPRAASTRSRSGGDARRRSSVAASPVVPHGTSALLTLRRSATRPGLGMPLHRTARRKWRHQSRNRPEKHQFFPSLGSDRVDRVGARRFVHAR